MSLGYPAPRNKNPEETKDEEEGSNGSLTHEMSETENLGGADYNRLNKQLDLDQAVKASILFNLRLSTQLGKPVTNL